MYGDIGQFMSNMGTSFLKQEEERQKSASAIKGFLNDPYYQQQIAQNPELTAEMGKIQSGKAKLSDVRGFLGTLSTMQHMREETMKADQMEAQKQYNQALREQTLANTVATEAAVAERERMRDEALARARLLKDVFGTEKAKTVSPEDNAFFESVGGPGMVPTETRQRTASESFREFVARGGVPDEATIRMFGGLMGEETAAEKTEAQRAIAAERAAGAAATQAAKTEGAVEIAKVREEVKSDPSIRAFKQAAKDGIITEEKAAELIGRRLEELVKVRQLSMADFMEALVTPREGDGKTSITKPNTTKKPSTSDQYRVISARPGPGD
jgi:transcription initiation factor IIF auxiliary subunit